MRRVTYRCPADHRFQVEVVDDGQIPEHACECGAPAKPCRIEYGAQPLEQVNDTCMVLVKNRPYEFNPEKVCTANAVNFGGTAEGQHAHYQKYFGGLARKQKALRSSASKNKPLAQWVGGMPAEMALSIGNQEGDREVVYKDPTHFLKKTGLYHGD